MQKWRGSSARRANFILTSLRLRNKGFYTPYDYLDLMEESHSPYPAIVDLFERKRPEFSEFISHIGTLEQTFLQSRQGDLAPNWNSSFISRLDGAAIFAAVTKFHPRKIIEIGSGNSTFFLCRANADHNIGCQVTCIDPSPRVAIEALPVQLSRRPLSENDLEAFEHLEQDDFVFVDSSHILQPGFDVDIILNRILPRLRKGVIVHFHDIFLPYPYPPHWQ